MKPTDLHKIADTPLAVAENDAQRAHARNRVYIGAVNVSASTVTAIGLDRQVPNVKLSSCLDVSHWQPVVADTREPVDLPTGRLTKYLIATTLEEWPEGWRVVRDEPQGKKC
ncbi:secreted protein/lipoprotein [Streptomyces sp. NPDC005574]|uniref:secreted protein/lipoprotein n=1 Tax=Streptomyces sp. NPDC005574 TaxID=3156891 RepID=UPI00339EA09D